MATDTYDSFAELNKHERPDRDYRISIRDVGSSITILAPHGGKIEPNTSEIARRIADEKFNYYSFEGVKKNNNACLHITSHNFDEPAAIGIISKSDIVITIHACSDTDGQVYVGGLDGELKKRIAQGLTSRGIRASLHNSRFQGSHPDNLCNRGTSGKGVQLEITRDLRDDPDKIKTIAEAVQASLENSLKIRTHGYT